MYARDEEPACPPRPCYITVTAVPALNACKECFKVASSYEEDEMAEAWNSCVRLSCLDHGMTVHTTFDLVPPYPNFEPKVSLKRDSGVVINAGNLLHFLNFVSTLQGVTFITLLKPFPQVTSVAY